MCGSADSAVESLLLLQFTSAKTITHGARHATPYILDTDPLFAALSARFAAPLKKIATTTTTTTTKHACACGSYNVVCRVDSDIRRRLWHLRLELVVAFRETERWQPGQWGCMTRWVAIPRVGVSRSAPRMASVVFGHDANGAVQFTHSCGSGAFARNFSRKICVAEGLVAG